MANRLTFTVPAIAFSALTVAGCSTSSGSMSADSSSTTATSAAPTVPTAVTGVERTTVDVAIIGGYDTDPVDNGRPVVLVASLLGVPTEVFRLAFTGVTPAAAGDAPEAAQVSLNKQALLDVLGPYGVTNDALDNASNAYRYSASQGEVWARQQATAEATITDGEVSAITITDPGRGYTSTPTVTITMPDGSTVAAAASLRYTDNVATNGSIAAITLDV